MYCLSLATVDDNTLNSVLMPFPESGPASSPFCGSLPTTAAALEYSSKINKRLESTRFGVTLAYHL